MKVLVTLSLCLVSLAVAENAVAPQQRYLRALQWSDCGDANTIAVIKELSVGSDPIPIPGSFKMTLKYAQKRVVDGSNFRTRINLKKKVLGLTVAVPCIADIGSCTYKDTCALINKFYNKYQRCPMGLPIQCQCPMPAAADAGFTDQTITIPKETISGILSWLAAGNYELSVDAKLGDEQAVCLKAKFKLG